MINSSSKTKNRRIDFVSRILINIKGQLIRTLRLGSKDAGVYTTKDRAAYWDGRDSSGQPVASGAYFYTLQSGEFRSTRKMAIVK